MALWLYAGLPGRLSKGARNRIEADQILVSPMTELELAFLHEVGRAGDTAPEMLKALRRSIGLEVADISFGDLAHTAASISWTRDPFDRLIAAHAIVADAPLVTADRTILQHLPNAVWD